VPPLVRNTPFSVLIFPFVQVPQWNVSPRLSAHRPRPCRNFGHFGIQHWRSVRREFFFDNFLTWELQTSSQLTWIHWSVLTSIPSGYRWTWFGMSSSKLLALTIPGCRLRRNKIQARLFKGNVQVELGSYVCRSMDPTITEFLTCAFALKTELHPICVRISI